MSPLEQMLRAAGADADWPPAPDLAKPVMRRIAADGRGAAAVGLRTRPALRLRRPLAIALAALLLLAAGAAAIPGIREPVLDWLGLRSVQVERVPAPLPEAPGQRLALGERTTLAAARRRLGFQPLLPAGLGAATVWYDSFPPGGQLGLVYRGGRLFLTEVEGRVLTRYLFKFLGPDAKADALLVAGERGLWIHGHPHQYGYADKTGEIRTDTIRSAGNTLLWRHGPLLLRLEGARSRAEALRIARSARAAP